MRAVMVMYDSLNRRMLPPYGADPAIHAPNFVRLAQRTVTFDTCYAGSMPCMPARREMHTGRHNFLHRSWGPLEPFDDSVPEMLKDAGVHTHLATDHQHYWEDGGATYHNRYSTYEFFRGQEGDLWKGQVAEPEAPPTLNTPFMLSRQDWVNRQHLSTEDLHPQTLTFDAGLEFIETNHADDSWFVQIETFDPHEPFFSYADYHELYGGSKPGEPVFDWPSYRRVVESPEEVEIARRSYFALLSQCDRNLGRVLDAFDHYDLWQDTMLIVCTDHGFLLGERGWWGKSVQPWFDETIHTPLFLWDPRLRVAGERRDELVQTIDLGPTLLEFFGVELTDDMQGRPLRGVIGERTPIREAGLFGSHGGHVNVTDGRYVYMRACATPANQPLSDYTLMPTHMRSRFSPAELRGAELVDGFGFCKGAPLLKVPAQPFGNPYGHGTLLFDLETDPLQREPLADDAVELRMAQLLVDAMRANDAPAEQYERLGLPVQGPVTADHLLVEAQWTVAQRGLSPAARRADFAQDALVNTLTLAELRRQPQLATALGSLGAALVGAVRMPRMTVIEALAAAPGIGLDDARAIEQALAAAVTPDPEP